MAPTIPHMVYPFATGRLGGADAGLWSDGAILLLVMDRCSGGSLSDAHRGAC
ncbi:hypothetical protein [Snodgrassella gandavensis]|uniref:hypothetical protein n=1 Tax=Snodgrassella gandavensis TaxID=2946698 RepID=UPI001EF68FD7|nr:hypothetical protein [Snodgrassella gandavensis]